MDKHHRNTSQNHSEISPHTCQNSYHQKRPQITNVGEDVEKRELLCTAGGNVNWCSHYGKQYGVSFKKLELPYDTAIPPCDMHLKKTKTPNRKDTCIPMFTAELLTIVKIWKQHKYPSTDEQINMYTMEYYSATKIMKFCHLQQHG